MSSVFFFLFLQHCFIYILVLLLCCVSRSSLYCNIHSDLSTLCLSCYFLSIVVSLYLLCCAYRSTLYCNIPSDLCTLYLSCYFFHIVLSLYLLRFLCCVYRSSLYCNIPSDLCTLCLSCYYFYIVLSLYLYCCYVVYPDHHFTVISIQTLRGSHGPYHMVVAFTITYANQCLSLLI